MNQQQWQPLRHFDLSEHLKKTFGYSEFREGQLDVIQKCLAGDSLIALFPTGHGKSLLYQFVATLPSNPSEVRQDLGMEGDSPEGRQNQRGPALTIVVSPLIALIQDQVQQAMQFGVSAAGIHSQLSAEKREKTLKQLAEGQFSLLFVTPERFRKSDFLSIVIDRGSRLLVIDEAHCISDWGFDFRPDYSKLGEVRRALGQPPVLALTATASPHVQQEIAFELNIPLENTMGIDLRRPQLSLNVIHVDGQNEKIRATVGLLNQFPGPAIFYFSLISSLRKISEQLLRLNIDHRIYHGDLNRSARQRNQKQFIGGQVGLLLATPAFGLGVHKSDIRLIVHFEPPKNLEAYFQEAGRAGRDGLPSHAFLLYDPTDLQIPLDFLNWSNPDASFLNTVFSYLKGNEDLIAQQGIEALKEKILYKYQGDYRTETALQILEHVGAIQFRPDLPHRQSKNPKGRIVAVAAPEGPWMDADRIDARMRRGQERLLKVAQYAKMTEGCRQAVILSELGVVGEGTEANAPCGFAGLAPCGVCDLDRGFNTRQN